MARRKITKTKAGPKLTAKQMKFCEGILAGLSQAEAYRQAYDCSQMGDASIYCAASRLRSNTNIALWLDAVTTMAGAYTLDDHRTELTRLKAIALRTGNVGAAVQAEQLIGKASGHYVEQYADITYDPLRTLRQIAEINPELARALAAKHNIPLLQLEATKH